MVDFDEARARVASHLQSQYGPAVVLVDEATRDEDVGWVFFYESADYLRTGDIAGALAGNAPIVVDKTTGDLHITGTAEPVEVYLEQLRETLHRA